MTTEHLRLLDDAHSTHLFFRMGKNLARGQVPEVAVAAVRSGKMALSKEDGSVRGIVKAATVPHQYALSQALCRLNPWCHSHVSGWNRSL